MTGPLPPRTCGPIPRTADPLTAVGGQQPLAPLGEQSGLVGVGRVEGVDVLSACTDLFASSTRTAGPRSVLSEAPGVNVLDSALLCFSPRKSALGRLTEFLVSIHPARFP